MKTSWDEMNIWDKARLLAYDQIRSNEEMELVVAQVKATRGV